MPDTDPHINLLLQCISLEEKEQVKRFSLYQQHTLKSLKAERVRLELEKAFEEEKPSLFFEALQDLRVLEHIFPSIYALQAKDFFAHTMLTLNHIRNQTNDLTCLYAVLLCDLGVIGATDFLDKYAIQKQKRFILAFVKHHLNVHRALELSPKELIDLLQAFRITKSHDEALKNLIICAKSGKFLIEVVKVLESLDLETFTKDVPMHKRKDVVLMHKIQSLKRGSPDP